MLSLANANPPPPPPLSPPARRYMNLVAVDGKLVLVGLPPSKVRWGGRGGGWNAVREPS